MESEVLITRYRDPWLLYMPGQDVYVRVNGRLKVTILDLVAGLLPMSSGEKSDCRSYTCDSWSLSYDGTTIGR